MADAEKASTADVLNKLTVVQTRIDELNTAIDAAKDADDANTVAENVFKAQNANKAFDYSTADTIKYDGIAVATLSGGQWTADATATANLTGFAEYLAAYQAKTTAEAAAITANTNLTNAVKDVVAAETGKAVTIADDMIDITNTTNGKADVTVDFGEAGATAPGADPAVPADSSPTPHVVAEAATFLLDYQSAADSGTVIFDGVTYTAASGDGATPTAFIAAINASTGSANWTAELVAGNVVKFTAKVAGQQAAITDVAFTGTAAQTGKVSGATTGADAAAEVHVIQFANLTEGQSITVEGVTVTASAGGATAAEVGAAIFNELKTGANPSTNWTATTDDGSGKVTFTANTEGVNVDDPVITTAGTPGDDGDDTAPLAKAVLVARQNLDTAEKALEDFNATVTRWEDAKALDEEVKLLEKAVSDAETELGDAGYKLQAGAATSDDSDVIFFDNLSPAGGTINGFGAKYAEGQGDYLVATDFTLVKSTVTGALTSTTKLAGEAGTLEVFAVQNNANVDLYFEKEEAAGNLNYAGVNFTKVTLAGVTLDDLSEDGGIISAAL